MKPLRRAFHFLLAATLMLALTIPAFATVPPYSITVTNVPANTGVSINGNTYSAYKIFNVTYDKSNPEKPTYAYTVDSSCLDVTYNSLKGSALISWLGDKNTTDGNRRSFADYVYINYIKDHPVTPAGSATASDEIATIGLNDTTTAGPGYYLVYGTASSGDTTVTASVSLTTAAPDVTVNPKLSVPTLKKEIQHNEFEKETDKGWGKVGDNQIGDTVHYRTITTVPDTTSYTSYTYVIHDTMTSGLTFNSSSVSIMINDGTASATTLDKGYYNVDANPTDNHTFDVTVNILDAISKGVLKADDKLTTYYTATLNANAAVYNADSKHNDNTAYLEYSNNPYDNNGHGKTPPVTVYDWTFTMGVNKTDGTNTLSGAVFVLSKDNTLMKDEDGKITNAIALIDNKDNTYTIAPAGTTDTNITTTISAGSITIEGLDDSITYYLHETKAPDGYNLLPGPVTIQISADYDAAGSALSGNYPMVKVGDTDASSTMSTNVVNHTGNQLPGTGGMGTTAFYAVGGTLAAGAAIMLIARKRVKNGK